MPIPSQAAYSVRQTVHNPSFLFGVKLLKKGHDILTFEKKEANVW